MSTLAAKQLLLARLYTDVAFRGRYFAEPELVGSEFQLAPDSSRELADSCRNDVARFARSLQHKRMNEATKLLPLTCRALKRNLGRLFLSYAVTPPPPSINKPRADAEGFAAFLAAVAAQGKLRPAWTAELAQYELSVASARRGRARLQVQRFRHDIAGIARAIARGGRLPKINGRPSLVLRWRRGSETEPLEWSLRIPWTR